MPETTFLEGGFLGAYLRYSLGSVLGSADCDKLCPQYNLFFQSPLGFHNTAFGILQLSGESNYIHLPFDTFSKEYSTCPEETLQVRNLDKDIGRGPKTIHQPGR